MHDVFISYSSKDIEIAERVCHYLECNNIRCWYAPRNIDPGKEWPSEIVNAIRSAKVFVLISSINSNTSKHVLSEIVQAGDANCTIIPFKIDKSPMSSSMSYYLQSLHWLDCSDIPFEHALIKLHKKILDALRIFPPPPPPPPPSPKPKVLKVVLAAILALCFLVSGYLILDFIFDDTDPEPVVQAAQSVEFKNLSTFSGYRYPFYNKQMISADADLFVLQDTEDNSFVIAKTDTLYITESDLKLDIEDYSSMFLYTTSGSDTAYIYNKATDYIYIYNKAEDDWNAEGYINGELSENDELSGFYSCYNDVTNKSYDPDIVFIFYKDSETNCFSKYIRLSPDGKYTDHDISSYNLTYHVGCFEIPDQSLFLMIDKKNKPVILDLISGTALDCSFSTMKDEYFPYLSGNQTYVSPDKKHFSVQIFEEDGSSKLSVWSTETGKSVFSKVFLYNPCYTFTNDNKFLYFSTESSSLVSIDLETSISTTVLSKSYFENSSEFRNTPYAFYYVPNADAYIFNCYTADTDTTSTDQIIFTDKDGNVLCKSLPFSIDTEYYSSHLYIDSKKIIYAIIMSDEESYNEDKSDTTELYQIFYTVTADGRLEFSKE